jgi:sialic acid synthase SpsE
MNRLISLKKFSNVLGYSGHLSSIEDAILAISSGATYIEKHFTIDNNLPGRDNKFAILPSMLKSLSDFREKFNYMNIDHGLDLQECEMDTYKNYRGRWSKSE